MWFEWNKCLKYNWREFLCMWVHVLETNVRQKNAVVFSPYHIIWIEYSRCGSFASHGLVKVEKEWMNELTEMFQFLSAQIDMRENVFPWLFYFLSFHDTKRFHSVTISPIYLLYKRKKWDVVTDACVIRWPIHIHFT